jgi:hypothetical protein
MRNALSLEKMGPSWASGSSTSKVLDPTLKNDPTMALSRLNQIADGVCDTGCRTELPRGAPRSVRCRNQAITRFDRWSMSAKAIFQQLPRGRAVCGRDCRPINHSSATTATASSTCHCCFGDRRLVPRIDLDSTFSTGGFQSPPVVTLVLFHPQRCCWYRSYSETRKLKKLFAVAVVVSARCCTLTPLPRP